VAADTPQLTPSTKSQRSVVDSQALMGVATNRSVDRLAAAAGLLDAAPLQFEAVDDVPMGGVLCALPALLALARLRSLESLRYRAPGEWGKLLGLDRSPEVKTMRNKLGVLCDEPGRAQRFGSVLAKEWMSNDEQAAGTLYIDGHVRVYTGHLTKLPGRPAVLRCDANRRSGFVERVAR